MNKNEKNKRIDFFIDQFMGLDHQHTLTEREFKKQHRNSLHGWDMEECDPSKAIRRNFTPSHPFLVDFGAGIDDETSERLFSQSKDFLVSDINALIGDGFECALLSGLSVMWIKIVPTDLKRLKGISAMRHDAAFEWHYRVKCFDGSGQYIKRIVATYKNTPAPIFYNGAPMENIYDKLIAICSLKEDLYRKGVFHTTFTNADTGTGLTMALSGDNIIDLMKFRDSPRTESGRKRPILHWVKEHIRHQQSLSKAPTSVNSHQRGIERFESDGCLVSIEAPRVTFEQMKTAS